MITQLNGSRRELLPDAGSVSTVPRRLSGIVQRVRPQLEELLTRQPGFTKHLVDIASQLACSAEAISSPPPDLVIIPDTARRK